MLLKPGAEQMHARGAEESERDPLGYSPPKNVAVSDTLLLAGPERQWETRLEGALLEWGP